MHSGVSKSLTNSARAAIVMSLVQSAKMHGHNPWAYLKDVLTPDSPTGSNLREEIGQHG